MSKYLGDFSAGDVIDFKFTTYRPSTGAPFTLAGSPVVSVYKNNDVIQDTAGAVLTVDFDGVTGLHHVRITANPAGGFYTDGGEFECVITTGTVDSVSVVGSCIGRFTLRSQAALYPATAGRTLDINASGHGAANVHQMQAGVVTAAAIATGAIDADALAADAATEIAVATLTTDISGYVSPTAGYAIYQGLLEAGLAKSFAEQMTFPAYIESHADTLLGRNVGGGSNAGRLVKEALYALRNKSVITGTTLSVYDASDALSWTAAVASSASADPVTGIDP